MTRFRRTIQSAKGWIYPPVCGSCEAPLSTDRQLKLPFLCEGCEEALTPIGDDYCQICGQSYETKMPGNFGCVNCGGRELAMDFAVSAYRSSGMARELMHAFKYGKQLPLARLMGTLLERVWSDPRLHEVETWLVVPVPLHPRRLRERGFNQSRELALEFIRRSGTPDQERPELKLFPSLKRIKHTVRQAQLDRKDRLRNAVGAYELKRSVRLPDGDGIGILIVDDVITTGTTVSECASTLRRSFELDSVAAISVMRG